MKYYMYLFSMLCLMAVSSVGAKTLESEMSQKKIPVIYDSDIGDDIDDTWALGMVLCCPELDVKLVVGDMGKPEYRAKLMAKLLERAGRTDIPVGMAFKNGTTGGGNQSAWVKDYDLNSYPGKIYKDGVQAIIDTIMKSPEPVTLICVGPVPNIAEALRREPRIAQKALFVGMHGSVRLGYGGNKKISAEYNVRADVKACQAALSAPWDITITPLDTCGLVRLTGEKYQKVVRSQNPIAKAIIENYRIWSKRPNHKDVSHQRSSTLFDTVAVYLSFSQALCHMEDLGIRVDDEGYTRIDADAKVMRVATSWKDMGAFEDLLVARVTGIHTQADVKTRELALEDYVNKMKAGWIGQMAGVGWGGPTEFKWKGQIIPVDEMPSWKPERINQFEQDDIYVEMTFLKTLEDYGMDCSIRQAGIDFANSGYRLWHANRYGRENLRKGIAPPDSGHPQLNGHADDIDYQIEADYSGLIAPGMPQIGIQLGEKFGRLMNYGDGLYGGQFVAGMYAEAFFEQNMEKVVRAGLKCIPGGSQYHECISDVLTWYQQHQDDWQKTWQLIEDKYQDNPAYRQASCDKGDFNIDAKINGAYIVMGLLYGQGDPDKTIIISTRCGQDSDCNPSNAAGILFTSIGYWDLPTKYTAALDPEGKFSHTPYTFPKLVSVCEQLARQSVVRVGGRIEKTDDNREIFVIPVLVPKPSKLEQCWEPGPIANSRFTDAEMMQIQYRSRRPKEFISTWQISGPYIKADVEVGDLFDVAFGPEIDMSGYWETITLTGTNREVVLSERIGGENRVAYLRTRVYSPSSREAVLELGSDDGVKVWLNHTLIHSNNVIRSVSAAEDKVDIALNQGWNDLLVKVTQGVGGWGFIACLADEDGKVLKDLKVSPH